MVVKAGEFGFNVVLARLPNRLVRRSRSRYLRILGAHVGDNVRLSSNIKVLGARNLVLGDDVSVANRVILDARGGLRIGSGALVGFESVLLTYTHAWPDPSRPIHHQGVVSKPIVVSPLSWIGMRVLVLPGAEIGRSSVIGAGSVVTKSVPDDVVAAGIPCVVVKARRDRSSE